MPGLKYLRVLIYYSCCNYYILVCRPFYKEIIMAMAIWHFTSVSVKINIYFSFYINQSDQANPRLHFELYAWKLTDNVLKPYW